MVRFVSHFILKTLSLGMLLWTSLAMAATQSGPPVDRYAMANGCYSLKSIATNSFVVGHDDTGYSATASGRKKAAAFFMKPTALGQYLFYSQDRRLMTANGRSVTASNAATDAAIWMVSEGRERGVFLIESAATRESLIVDAASRLALGVRDDGNDLFRIVSSNAACEPYPEMPVNMRGSAYQGQGVDQPVIGFSDVHSHITMAHEMSADDSAGPSAGGTFFGQPFHRLGVAHALGDCAEFHGPNGIRDGNNILESNPVGTHDTTGWPSFVDWPAARALTHQAAYYRWVERAYLAGLRVLVNYGTNIKGLCDAGRAYSGNLDADCNDHSVGMKQNDYVRELQDYVDAQSGGPGKGWLRIVLSPQEAREVINDGKLAVILGLEASQLFDCGVTFLPDGTESRHCDRASFDKKLEDAYARGVRQLVPIHNMNNSFGGSAILNGAANSLNAVNFLDTKRFYETYDCPNGGEKGFVKPAGSYMTTVGLPMGEAPILMRAVMDVLNGPLPVYNSDVRQCNVRQLTDLGEYAFRRFMEKGMVISLDHASLHSKRAILGLGAAQEPPYPIISGHGAQGGISGDMVKEIFKLGGYYYPYKRNGHGFNEFRKSVRKLYDEAAAEAQNPEQMLPFAFGIGYDANGFGGYNMPRDQRSPNVGEKVSYPFTLFEGRGWGEQFRAASIKPVIVDQLKIPGGRMWDTEIDGTAHYGLVADFVEEVRIEGGEEAINALYNSAEAYLQLWEKVYNGRPIPESDLDSRDMIHK